MSDETVYHTISGNLIILTNNHDAKPDKNNFTKLIGQLADRLSDLKLNSVELITSYANYKLEKGKFISTCESADVASDLRSRYELILQLKVSKDEIDKLESVLWMICKRPNFSFYDLMCRFYQDFDQFYIKPVEVDTLIPLNVTKFDFGNMINVNRFVSNGQYFLLSEKKQYYTIQNRSGQLVPDKKVLNLRFEIAFLEDSSRRPTIQTFRMEFPYESITEINVCFSQEVELYFFIKYPPKIYLNATIDSEFGHKHAEGRWIMLKPIDTENLGRCDVFKMKVKGNNFQTVYGAIQQIVKPISITPIHVYSVENDHFQDGRTFPFNVHYALHCILYLTTAFHDELFIRGKTEEIFDRIIYQSVLQGREDVVIETLYRLFAYYSTNRVHDAVEKFKEFFDEVISEPRKEEEDITEILVRKVIWTPTHSRLLPPCKVKTELILEDVDIEDLLQVFLLDEDLTPLTGDGIGESNLTLAQEIEAVKTTFHRGDYLKNLVDERFPLEGKLCICNRNYRYMGTAHWPLFEELHRTGILLKADKPTTEN